jgi:glycosyltransferase involved in cell wall biosynthesis
MDTRIYFKQVCSLARAGHTVYLVARAGGEPVEAHYVPVPAPASRRDRFRTILHVLREARQLRCDVYHVHDPELLPGGVLLKWLTRARLVYDVHENVREQIRNKFWIPAWLRGCVAAVYDLAERLCLPGVDHVVLAEDSYRDTYPRPNVTVVRNYPLLPAAALAATARAYSDQPILGYCGVVAEIRGALVMVDVLAALRREFPRAELRVIGPCQPESLAAQLRERAAAHGVPDGLTLYGRMPLDRALEEIGRCDIGLALLHPDPNYVASLPTKMFEYMSLRMPVVVSDFPLWRSIVDGAGSGLAVDPLDAAAIARQIAGLCRDPECMRRLGENGRRDVLERYSWTAEERKLLAIYDAFGSVSKDNRGELQADSHPQPGTGSAANGDPDLVSVGSE